jgi:putative sigma-54 modulation protein
MLILINGSGFQLSSELREQVQEKLEASLARFSERLAKLNVFMADVNGPKKGVDKSIRLVIDIKSRPVIVIEEKGQAWMNILGMAADRAAQTLTRKVQRFRSRGDRTSSARVEAASFRQEGTE